MKKRIFFQSPIGRLTIEDNGTASAVSRLYFEGETYLGDVEELEHKDANDLLKSALDELKKYFEGSLKSFSIPVEPEGTEFRLKVWQALRQIPYGQTRTYSDIAKAVDNPKGVRAIGQANHHNPIPIIIPCHRVIGKNGSLTGFGGGLDAKKYLLKLEGIDF